MYFMFGTDFPEDQLEPMLNSLGPFSITFIPPGITLYQLLDSLNQPTLNIVETGCTRDTSPTGMMSDGWSSFYFAKWIHEHNGSLTTIDIDPINLGYCQIFLKRFRLLSDKVSFIEQDSVQAIKELKQPVDVFYLDSCDGLDHGLAEFQAALVHRPKMIIMDDFTSKAAKAVEFATQEKISFQQIQRYTVFKS